MLKLQFLFVALLFSLNTFTQNTLEGKVIDTQKPIPFATIQLENTGIHSVCDSLGRFKMDVGELSGEQLIVIKSLGYKTLQKKINIQKGQNTIDFNLQEDPFLLEQVIVSSNRLETKLSESPIHIEVLSSKVFEAAQSTSIAEGLSYSPGLRIENNCQNCGFTQLRMNGLDGPYTQILINSRPVFSALAGVYALEMIPTSMIERIEVVKGGGSSLFGGNAIAGTVNILTREADKNAFEFGANQSLINLEASERTYNANTSLLSKNKKSGMHLFGFVRDREPWDANQDGFSEITQLRNRTLGFDAFHKTGEFSKLRFSANYINEFRRGGNGFDRLPHQSDISEQLEHSIFGGSIDYELYSKNLKHRFSAYSSAQYIERNSYFGAGGRIIPPNETPNEDDLLALNAYGKTFDMSWVGGLQSSNTLGKKANLVSGVEYQTNSVNDQMPGYSRKIKQDVATLGIYSQFQYAISTKLTALLGARLDHQHVKSDYNYPNDTLAYNRTFIVPVPRIALMFDANKYLKMRASYAQGYRTPQAYDEDLHIETVGGSARFVELDPDLKTERSQSYTLSAIYSKHTRFGDIYLSLESFYTQLQNTFIIAENRLSNSGTLVLSKRNGGAANVYGVHTEMRWMPHNKWEWQGGITLQKAEYANPELIWEADESLYDDISQMPDDVETKGLLRTPNIYGFSNLTFKANKALRFSSTAIYTGSMLVAHMTDANTTFTEIKETNSFLDLNIKTAYEVTFHKKFKTEFYCGVKNLFNSYQNDFDSGVERDATYVYGPMLPRTVFFGLKVKL